MNCVKCKQVIVSNEDFLTCFQCAGHFHLQCLGNITKDDLDFIKSSGSNWKCGKCGAVKASRNDDTPLTPTVGKVFDFKPSESDNESESSTGNTRSKIVCAKCSKGFAHNSLRIYCSECKNLFHLKCTDPVVTKENYTNVKNSWLCRLCRARPREGTGKADKDAAADKRQPESRVTLSDILSEMMEFRKEVKQTNKEFTESLQKYSEWIEESSKQIGDASVRINEAVSKIDYLHQENINLKKTVQELSLKISTLEQSLNENTLEINGVPVLKNENVMETVKKVADAIGYGFDENKIDNCYRFKSAGGSNRPGGLFVKFVRKIDMQQFILKRKQKRNLNSRDLGFMDGEASVIYVNNRLTQDKRRLLNDARTVRKEKNYTFLWVSDGRILMRKNEGDKAVVISCREDLDKLI